MSEEVPEQYRPRLCHVVKWREFQGYGFNLCAEKGKSGQFIGKIDEKSPAEAAGLKEGDRIVEVNDVNIGNENHQQVVTRIKSGDDETRLLVVDTDADQWYKTHKRVVRGDLPEVRVLSSKRDEVDSGHKRVNGDDEHVKEVQTELEKIEVSPVSAPLHNGTAVNEDNLHRPRLCHLKFWSNFQGYGFNLHAEKDKPGQYIGLVDDNSPASTGGLKVNDRIIEVNGVNVEQEKHTQVIGRIKELNGETKLLVVDKQTDSYYQKKGIKLSSSMPQTELIVTPVTAAADSPAAANRHHIYEEIKIDEQSDIIHVSHGIDLDDIQTGGHNGEKEKIKEVTKVDYEHEVKAALAEKKEKAEDAVHDVEFGVATPEFKHQPTTPSYSHQHSSSSSKGSDDFELNLSVAEMKERLKSKKRQDPRASKVPFDQKYKDFQRM